MDRSPPRFAVIIPTYNRPDLLREAIDSVLAQTTTNFECIVVDDASPTPVSVPTDARVRLIRQPRNAGAAAAINAGVAAARADVVTILADDDWLTPHRLELAERALRHAPIALCWFQYSDEPPRPGRVLNGNVHDVVLDDIAPSMGAMAISREHWQPIDERYRACEDLEWWLRITRDHTVATAPDIGYLVRRHQGARHASGPRARIEFSYQLMRDHSEYFRTHRRARGFRLMRIGVTALSIGDRKTARSALARSLVIRPSARTAVHLARSVVQRPRAVASD